MAQTRPQADQLRFFSSTTGEHIIDAYLEEAERGSRRLGELMADLFDATTGQLIAQGFRDYRGDWATGIAYLNGDVVRDPATQSLYVANANFTSGATIADDVTDGHLTLFFDGTPAPLADIATVASNAADIQAVAGDIASVNQAASISGSIVSVADNEADIDAVALNIADVNAVAGNKTNIDAVAGNKTNIDAVAGNKTNIDQVAADTAHINALSPVALDLAALSPHAADIDALSPRADDIGTLAPIVADIQTAATNAAAISTAATNIVAIQNAPTEASNAASSASDAAAARDAANAARDAALDALDSFDDRYLGAKATEPTLDNDGNALVAGALFFDTTAGAMKLYTGSSWVAAYVSGSDFLPLTGGTLTGNVTLENTSFTFKADSNKHIWFRDNLSNAEALLYFDASNEFVRLQAYQVGGAAVAGNFQITQAGNVSVTGLGTISLEPFGSQRLVMLSDRNTWDDAPTVFDTNTNAHNVYITRSGSTINEFTSFGQDDSGLVILTKNDEAVCQALWSFEATDTEAGGGAAAGTSVLTLGRGAAGEGYLHFADAGDVYGGAGIERSTSDGSLSLRAGGANAARILASGNAEFDHAVTVVGDLTANGTVVGSNAAGARTISTSAPTGGADGDIWYEVDP